MDVKTYITSGILELYVAGLLSEEENREVHAIAQEHPEIASEIAAIETAVLALSKAASPGIYKGFEPIRNSIAHKGPTKVLAFSKKEQNWTSYLGWAASFIISAGLIWMYVQNKQLKARITITHQENTLLEQQIEASNSDKEKTVTLLNTLRDQNITVIALGGQQVSPTSYAKAYWNKKDQKVYIDAKGLPEPPDGFVYQVWSLKLSPLTPTSMGLLADFSTDDNKVFALSNPNESEAFGITLEPAGGSESPTLDQLYTLGVVAS